MLCQQFGHSATSVSTGQTTDVMCSNNNVDNTTTEIAELIADMSNSDVAEAIVGLTATVRQSAEPEVGDSSTVPVSVHVGRLPVLSRSACSSMLSICSDGKSILQNQPLRLEDATTVGNVAQQMHGQSQRAVNQPSDMGCGTDADGYGAFSSSASANMQPLQQHNGGNVAGQQVNRTGIIIF